MVLYETCKLYKKLLSEDTIQTITQTKGDLNESIITIIKGNKHVTLKEIAEKLNKTRDGIKYHITKMQKARKIRYMGKVKDGYWKIIK